MYYYNNLENKIKTELTKKLDLSFVHEVKNPLSLIKAHIEFLELDNNLSIYKNNISTIKKEINRISDIISDFILYHKETENVKQINIIPIIEENIKMLDIYNKNITFELKLNCDKKYFNLKAQPAKISMLFSNILKNAIEAIKDLGHIKIMLYIDNNKPIIDIIDNGEGLKNFSEEEACKPFVTSKKEGSGVGLSICKDILKDINGEFKIFNNEDAGCTVRITL